MGLRNWLQAKIRVIGQVFGASLHERLDGMEAMLHYIQQQNKDLTNQNQALLQELLEQNTHMAHTQTSLLQADIHLIEAVRKSHDRIKDAETRMLTMVRDHAANKADMRRLYGEVLELAGELQETLRANIETLHGVQRMIGAAVDTEDAGKALPPKTAAHHPGD